MLNLLKVPYFGPAPASNGTFHWPTVNTIQGPPVEYSWKWNTATGAPEVRYTFEAVDRFSGSPKDPLNQGPSRDLLYHIASAFPSVDLAWTNHFLATLFDHDQHRYAQEQDNNQITTTVMVAAEFVEPGVNIKVYLKSRRLGMREIPLEVYKDAISQVCPASASATVLYEFLDSDPEGQLLTPAYVFSLTSLFLLFTSSDFHLLEFLVLTASLHPIRGSSYTFVLPTYASLRSTPS